MKQKLDIEKIKELETIAKELDAENFLHYFIAPNILKTKLPEVYEELDSKIPNKFKILLNQLLK